MKNNSIEYGQYYANEDIDEIDLTDIKEIKESAFASSSIKHIKGVIRNPGTCAFSVCESLEGKIEVGGGKVGRAAFERCPLIKEVVLMDDVEQIDGWAFDECESLVQLILPRNLQTIGEEAFHKTGIKQLNIGRVDYIARNAFSECVELESVSIDEVVKDMAADVFTGCFGLKKITYNGKELMSLAENERFQRIDSYDGKSFFIEYEEDILDENGEVTTILHQLPIDIPLKKYTYEEPKKEQVSIEDLLSQREKIIPDGISRGCKTIIDIDLSCVEEIGDSAFDKCTNLKNVNLSSSLSKIGSCAFQDSGIESIDLSNTRHNSH